MIFEFTNDRLAAASPDAAVAFLAFEDALLPPEIGNSHGLLREVIDRALSRTRLTGALGQFIDVIAPCGTSAARILLVGCGAKAGFGELDIERAAAEAYRRMHATGATILELRFDPLEKQNESPVADIKNYGGPEGGAITAALFLQRFVNGCPWAHLDVAGTTWQSASLKPTVPDGAMGFGVRILYRLVAEYYDGADS